LASEANTATAAGDPATALVCWRKALELLPPASRQHEVVSLRAAALSKQLEGVSPGESANSPPAADKARRSAWGKGAAGLGTLGLLLWKLKFIAVFLLTKAKFLLLGLTKASTFLSMLLSFGVYWTAWGWQFALGLVLSIYVHEMGHVAALQRYGIRASWPMFIPGLGAVVRLRQQLVSAREDARVGLAGPLWGLGAAVVAFAAFHITGWPVLGAIARTGAWINLFNLLPVWQLDGARGFRALTVSQRWVAIAVVAGMWFWTAEGLLLLLLVGGVFFTLTTHAPGEPDRMALASYVFLVATLSLLCTLPIQMDQAQDSSSSRPAESLLLAHPFPNQTGG
jgi:Zn-dependent protease